MRIGSLFAGIGGLDAGVEIAWPGSSVAWQVDLIGDQVRRRHWPRARQVVADVRSLSHDRRALRRLDHVDVIAAGVPCQGLSVAGTRRGLDDPRSALYHDFIRILSACRPKWVIVENVPGLLGYRLRIDADLCLLGYGTQWVRCYAASAGAPHLRRRVFVIGELGGAARDDVVDLPPGPGEGRGWPTPTAGDARASGGRTASASCHDGESLPDAVVRYWATPTATAGAAGARREARNERLVARGSRPIGEPLCEQVVPGRYWATPIASQTGGTGNTRAAGGGVVGRPPTEQVVGRLNPAWVEQLMGLPVGWADPARTDHLAVDPRPAWPMPRYPVDWPRDEPWPQYAWEAPRTMGGPPMRGRPAWLRALGNAVVPQQAAIAIRAAIRAAVGPPP